MRLLQRPNNTAYNEDPIVGFRAPIELLEAFYAWVVRGCARRRGCYPTGKSRALLQRSVTTTPTFST
jgi:hypothetical protein